MILVFKVKLNKNNMILVSKVMLNKNNMTVHDGRRRIGIYIAKVHFTSESQDISLSLQTGDVIGKEDGIIK